jgi:hypothetical protein
MKKVIVFLVLVCAYVPLALGQKPAVVISNEPGWHKIGEISASFKTQSESIVVLGADRFSSIKLKVTDAPINIEQLQVFYESGDIQDIDVKNVLKAGAETRVLDLKSDEGLRKVAFTYKTLPNSQNEQAHVELYGYKVAQKDNTAYHNDGRDNDSRDGERTDDEVREEAREAEHEVREEAREADREAREEVREADREAREEARENDDEVSETSEDISEAAAIAAAEIKDKKYADKVGPNGEIVFIDKHARFYCINKKGHKVFLTKAQLRDKPKQ